MVKPYYFSPKYPPRHRIMEESMGRFLIVWGILELHLDSGIAAVLCIDPTLALTITANSGTKAKIDMLHSAVSMSKELLPEPLCDRAHRILGQISELSGRHRNALAHGAPVEIEEGWRWHRVSARQTLDVKFYNAPATRWKKAAAEVRAATRQWCRIYQEIWHILDPLPREQRDKAYHYVPKPG